MPISESTRSTRPALAQHADYASDILESESENSDISAPSYSMITATASSNSNSHLEENEPEVTSMDGDIDIEVDDAFDMPENTEVCYVHTMHVNSSYHGFLCNIYRTNTVVVGYHQMQVVH